MIVSWWRKNWCALVACTAPAAGPAQYLVNAVCKMPALHDNQGTTGASGERSRSQSQQGSAVASWLQAAYRKISTDGVLTSTTNAEKPLFATQHVPRTQYLRSARSNADKYGLLIAGLIMGSWATLIVYSMSLTLP